MADRVSIGYVEVIHTGDAKTRATRGYVEVIHEAVVPVRVTDGYAEAIQTILPVPVDVTTAYIEVVGDAPEVSAQRTFHLSTSG